MSVWCGFVKRVPKREREGARGRGDECTGTSKDQVHPREPGKRKLRRMKRRQMLPSRIERERALRVAVYICTRRIPSNVADFVCSRVRRVGAFELRIRFLSSRAPADHGKLPQL